MKKFLSKIAFTSIAIVTACLFLTILSLPACAEELVILHSNDTHSNLFPFGPHDEFGGIARMSTMIKELKSKNQNVIALHAGDAFIGTFAFNKYLGYPELKIMEGLYDAMALGNHEFDLGPEILGYILNGFNPITSLPFGPPVSLPLLCANGNFSGLEIDSYVSPFIIKDVGNLKVGLLGIVTDDPIYYSPSSAGLFSDPYGAAGITAFMLRFIEGCDIVVAVSHLGQAYDILGLSTVPNIDIIVGGHSHDYLPAQEFNGKIIVQAGAFGQFLGELKVDVGTSPGDVTLIDHTIHSVNREIKKDPAILPYLNELREGIYEDPRFGPVLSRYLAKAMWDHEEKWSDDDPYQQPGHRDTPLGNLVTDAIREGVTTAGYPVDLAIEGNGFIGHKLYAGKVVRNDLMQVLPYGYDPVSGLGFKIKIANLLGSEIFAAIEFSVSAVEYTDEIALQVSGLTFEYNSENAPPTPRVDPYSIEINGQPLIFDASYAIALNERLLDFLAVLGIDITGRVIDPDPDLLVFKLAEDYMLQLNHLEYTSEGRIIDTSEIP